MRDPSEVIAAARVLADFAKTAPGRLPERVTNAIETIAATPQPASADVDDAFVQAVWENLPSASNVCDEISLSQVRYALEEALAAIKGDSHAG